MKNKRVPILLFILILTNSIPWAIASNGTEKKSVIVVFKETPQPDIIKRYKGEIIYEYSIIPGIACTLPEQAIAALENNPNVDYIQENILYTATESYDWGVDRIDADLVHLGDNKGSIDGVGVKVAILDTGIDYNHPDLNVLPYKDEYGEWIDGWTWNDKDTMDRNGHGTHCAGIVAALINGEGIIGTAPEADLHAVKVLNEFGQGYTSDIIKGIDWSVTNGMQVISMSLGSDYYDEVFEFFCQTAYDSGVVIVAAAGNDYLRRGRREYDTVDYPARYDSVIAVGATGENDKRASFSSTGETVEVSAPGVNIYSTILDGGYDFKSGTSMACPHVTGLVALMLATSPGTYDLDGDGWDPAEIRAKLADTAEDLGDLGKDNWYGYGLVDAEKACGVSVDTNPPTVTDLSPTPESTVFVNNPVISATVSDESGISSIVMKIDDNIVGHNYDALTGTVSYDSSNLLDEWHTVSLTVTDNSDLFNSVTETWSFYVDTSGSGTKTLDVVLDVSLVQKKAGPNVFVTGEAVVYVSGDDWPISGATVTGHWVSPASETLSVVTDSNGYAVFTSSQIKGPSNGDVFEFTVTDVTYSGWLYNGPDSASATYNE